MDTNTNGAQSAEKSNDAKREEAPDRRQVSGCRPMSPYERTKAQVYATGNKWAIENFNATHN